MRCVSFCHRKLILITVILFAFFIAVFQQEAFSKEAAATTDAATEPISTREMYEGVLDTYLKIEYGPNYRNPEWRNTFDITERTYRMISFHTNYEKVSEERIYYRHDSDSDVTYSRWKVKYRVW